MAAAAPAPQPLTAIHLLDVVQTCLHAAPSEWIFLRELRAGTGLRTTSSAQRLDAFALNCFAHNSMKRICYEVKISRADFLCELKHPIKRRIGLRYSNEFYFVTPANLLNLAELPIECGLVEVGSFPEAALTLPEKDNLPHFDSVLALHCRVTVPAPWRETPPPTWQFLAAMLRNQQKALRGAPPVNPKQQRLAFD